MRFQGLALCEQPGLFHYLQTVIKLLDTILFYPTVSPDSRSIMESRQIMETQIDHEMSVEVFDERRVHRFKAQIYQLEKQVVSDAMSFSCCL